MSKTATIISEGWLKDLYLQRQHPPAHLVLQILAFQVSECNPKEIILRISDGEAFLDCLLVGPYLINNSKIMSSEYNRSSQLFQRYDLVRVSDFFCKIDTSKICQLRVIVRKLEEAGPSPNRLLGKPEEISELVENSQLRPLKPIPADTNNNLINIGTEDTPIKLEELPDDPPYQIPQNQPPKAASVSADSRNQKQEEPMTLEDIMAGKQGFFIGRLLRMKFGCKEAKDGPMSFLYLGFIDGHGSMVRIHLAGRMALKESKELKKGRVYFIRGLELFHGERTKCGPQIRLRDKEYKIHEIQNEAVKSQYADSYSFWEHEHQWVESEMVDVVGIVEGIEEKTTYRNSNAYQEQRDVVRLAIRNAFKTVKVSFWADHIAIIENLQLRRKTPILIEDIKKKKTVFLDFISESTITLLDDDLSLKQRLAHLLPPPEEAPQPTSLQELQQVCSLEPYSSKVRSLLLRIAGVNPKWIIYKMCIPCKKKVEKVLQTCLDCQKGDFVYKYNCAFQLQDSTGTLTCVGFDNICQKLFKCTANQFNTLSEQQIKELCEKIMTEEYLFGIEYKNSRQIIRTLEKILPQEKMEPFQQKLQEPPESSDVHQQ